MDPFAEQLAHAQQLTRTLGPFARGILVETEEGRFIVPVEDLYVGGNLRFSGHYQPGELERLRSLCDASTRLLVVGAHIGALAIPLSRHCRQLTAIEANPHSFELLQLNTVLNLCTNCHAIQIAASDKEETLRFVLNRVNSGGSKRMPQIQEEHYFFDDPEIIEVQACPLDALLANESFDGVLMDIEGSEVFALNGMQRILGSARFLQIEFLPHHLREVAGVSVAEFLAPIREHFASLVLPDRRLAIGRDRFETTLAAMAERNEGCESMLFLKAAVETVRFS